MNHPFKYFLCSCICIAIIWSAGLAYFIHLIPFVPSDNTERTDAIVVLTGGSLRLERGFQLLQEGKADHLFISGVENGITLESLLKNKEIWPYASAIPQSRIELGHKARSTFGNAEETAEWMERNHIKTIRLVTGNYHIPRSVHEIHQSALDVVIIPEPVFPGRFSHNDWWQSLDSMKLVISEYHKYAASVLAHRLLAEKW